MQDRTRRDPTGLSQENFVAGAWPPWGRLGAALGPPWGRLEAARRKDLKSRPVSPRISAYFRVNANG